MFFFQSIKKEFVLAILALFWCFIAHAEPQKTVAIFTAKVKGVKPWDPDSIQTGIAGSEEAVIYMSQSLAKLGYKVIVIGDPPMNSVYSRPQANPRFVRESAKLDPIDIAISWRMPEIAGRLKKRAAKVYLWPHDTHSLPLQNEKINSFNDVLWLSKAQREQWISVNNGFAKFTKIFGNGIVPEQFTPVQERKNPYSCIYGSNYARGLEILLDIWPKVKKQFPLATLDIYYGWEHWGLLSFEKEVKMRTQVANLAPLDVKEHGLVGHAELNQAYGQASFWTYPCTAFETFCITALRAQLAGAIPVILEGSALSETVRHGYQTNSPENYFETLKKAFQQAEKISLEERKNMSKFILEQFTWDAIALKWKELFEE